METLKLLHISTTEAFDIEFHGDYRSEMPVEKSISGFPESPTEELFCEQLPRKIKNLQSV